MKSHGYAAHDNKSALVPYSLSAGEPGPRDVVVEIAYCGICHSDIHQCATSGQRDVSHGARPRDRRRVTASARRSQVQAGRPRRHRRDGRLLPRLPQLQGEPGAVLREGLVGTYNAKGYDGVVVHGG